MPHRNSIIQDEDGVRSVSELPAMRPPHGNPGSWTAQVIKEISREFNVSADKLPEQLIHCSARRLREVLAAHPEDQTDLLPF